MENVVVFKGELDEAGEAILKEKEAMSQEKDDSKQEQEIKDEDEAIQDQDINDEDEAIQDQDIKDEKESKSEEGDLGATLVEQEDVLDATLVPDEEAFNATLENVKGESSSTPEPSTSSSANDDASSTTTAGTFNPSNVRLSVPPTDTDDDDDDSSTNEEDDDDEDPMVRPVRRFPGTVGLSRANANVSIYLLPTWFSVIHILLLLRPYALQESCWLIIQNWLMSGSNWIMQFKHLSSQWNNLKSCSSLCFHFNVLVLAGCDNKKKSMM